MSDGNERRTLYKSAGIDREKMTSDRIYM